MVIAILDENECNFAVRFDDETKKEIVKELMIAGLSSWYEAANEDIEEIEGNEYFTADEISMMYNDGYAEPTMELLKRYNINGEVIDVEYDKNDEVINADEVIWY